MGMFYILFLLIYILISIGIYRFIKHYINMKWVSRITLAILILIPTYDIIISNILGAYYCNAEPNPKTFINKKVEYPESIYWEDNIFGGFDADERKLMIVNYLDGVHLKTMALNGDDGKMHVYHYENIPKEYYPLKKEYAIVTKKYINCRSDWNIAYDSNDLKYKEIGKKCAVLSNKQDELWKILNKKINTFTLKEEIYDKSKMPQMNYMVTFDEVKLNPFSRKFLYSDETKIIDNKTSEVIAFNRRYMQISPNILMRLGGNQYYGRDSVCGDNTQYFFKNVFEKIHINSGAIAESFNSKLYGKYIKGE